MNVRKSHLFAATLVMMALSVTLSFPGTASADTGYGVYEYVVQKAEGSIGDISSSLEQAAADAGWQVVAGIELGAPKDCGYRAHVLVLYDAEYAGEIVKANRVTGPYAALDHIGIFQDENGTHVSVVNPHSINRTILMDDTTYEAMSETHLQKLRAMVLSAVKGTESSAQYGQIRTEGYIGKTMGVVAGGKYADLIREKASINGGDLMDVAEEVAEGLGEKGKKWGLALVYRVDMPDHGVVILGTTGTPMDSKSFDIVKGGGDESRKEFDCPGLSHAAAYPIEIIVSKDNGAVKVSMVDAMFRMKMYFEDAGKWAFMNNMKMPGSIDKELKKQIRNGLED